MDAAGKRKITNDLSEAFKSAQVVMSVNYRGLSVAKLTDFRRELRAVGATAKVVKNTLARLAVISSQGVVADDLTSDTASFIKCLTGPSMLVYSPDDPVTPAKVVEKFMDSTKVLSVNGVFIDGSFIEPDSFAEFCKMPGKAEVLSQLLSLINTPATNLLRLISAPAAQMVRVIAAYKEVLESRGN